MPVRDGDQTLGRTLAALRTQTLPAGDFEILVVDDGSRDGTLAVAREHARRPGGAQLRVLSQAPTGPGEARNAGVAATAAAQLAFCDADVFPARGWLEAGVAALEHADLVQGRVLPDPWAPAGPFDRTIWVTRPGGLYETANLFVRRELFEAVGGFDQWLRPRRGKALAEDVWFGERCLRAGARAAFCAEALAHHAVFPRSAVSYVAERARLRYFPAMVAQMPALRHRFLYRRLFLNRRTACFDLMLAGGLLAGGTGRRTPLLAALPYLRELRRHARARARPDAAPALPAIIAADLAADGCGTVALIAGSLANLAPVL